MSAGRDTAPILIAGGGIAGLTIAISLARRQRASIVLEARPEFSEAGAGIQLGPNVTRVLEEIGVLGELESTAVAPDAIVVRDAVSARELAELPLGAWMGKRHGAPYLVAHRADLQAALLRQARSQELITIHTDFSVEEVVDEKREVSVIDARGRRQSGSVLVGADGLWSKVREAVAPGFVLTYSGTTAARALVDRAAAPAALRDNRSGVWLAPNAHIVKYPVRAGREIAVVVIATEPQPAAGWGHPVDSEVLLARARKFDSELRALLEAAPQWHRWALFDPRPLGGWSSGRTVLIGDAAHPMLPYLAQGGAMGIEDGFVLGWLLSQHGDDPAVAFAAYDAQRRGRVGQVQRASRENGRIYHMSGLSARGRNLAMRAAPPERLMQRYDWVYGWRHNPDYGDVEL